MLEFCNTHRVGAASSPASLLVTCTSYGVEGGCCCSDAAAVAAAASSAAFAAFGVSFFEAMEDSIEFSLSEEQDDEAMTYTIMVKEDNNKMATKMLMMDKDLEPIFEHSLVACKRCGCLQEVPENATDNASDENGLTSQISGTDDGPPPAISITNQKVTSLSGKGEEHGNLATEEANSTKSPLYEEEHVEPIDVDRVKIVPKWQVKEDEMRQGIGSGRISGGLDPRCKERRKATLLTKEGPLEVG